MSSLAIRVKNISKRYRIGGRRQQHTTFREMLERAACKPVNALRSKLSRAQANGNSEEESIWALRNVSFEVRPGEVVGIIGQNGAGKSTLLKILSRITEPTEGYVEMWGRVGSLLEVGTGFHLELTGRENIFLNGAILGMTKKEIQLKFDEIVDFAEVEKFIDTPVKHYSSGMHLRLAFAVAAHLEPEVLLMDEVLAVGDAAFQKKCLGKMEEVAEAGRTVLFVSHNMTAVRELCKRAIWVHGGVIVEDGGVDEVTRSYLGTLTDGSVSHSNEHYGLTISGVCLRNSKGRPATQFAPGEDIIVDLGFEARQKLVRPIVALQIHGARGPCFSASMMLDGHRPEVLFGTGRLECRFRSVPLLPQIYTVRLTLRNGNGERILRPLDVAGFSIIGDLEDYGFQGDVQWAAESTSVVVSYTWTLPDGSERDVSLNDPPLKIVEAATACK
jgi:lipopolysaccharide transport system ATP-binding protein